MITYGLGTYTIHPEAVQNNPNASKASINIPIGLSREEYTSILDSISKVGNIFRYSTLHSATAWNYDDLVNTVDSYIQAFNKKDFEFLGKRDVTLNINKEVLNLLTSFRFYLDFIDENLHKDFGKNSEIVAKFRSYCSEEYDGNFSYRFVYHLRNFAQHKGLVLSSVKYGKFIENVKTNQVSKYLNIFISRNDIIEDKKFKKEVRAELIKYPENLDLMEHLSKWMNSLTRIHERLMNIVIPSGLGNALFVIEQAEKLNYDKYDDHIMPIISVIDHPKENIKGVLTPSFIPLPISDARKIIEYCKGVQT